MTLAAHMREVNVDEMLSKISFKQFLEWEEYTRTSPFDSQRGDWHAASICAAFMNGIAVLARSKKRFRVKDFVLEFGAAKNIKSPTQTWQGMKSIARMWTALSKAENKKRKR